MQYRLHTYSATLWDVYWFEKNIQGDVVAIYNSQGTKLISYVYTAYGICGTNYHNGGLNTTAIKNRLTYRGYYFDMDLQMYYLNSRYYNQNTCRFISPDSVMSGANGSLHGFNLYAYCFNNPVNMTDASGNWPEWIEKFGTWLKENVGAAVVFVQKHPVIKEENLFYGYESGVSADEVVSGNVSKPISLYSAVSSENVLDNKLGLSANINNGGVALETNIVSNSVIIAGNGNSVEIMIGLDKVGYTYKSGVDFGQRTADAYHHEYIKTLPTAGVVVSIIALAKWGGILLPLPA